MKKSFTYLKAHKILSAVILILIIGISYYTYKKTHAATQPTRYVLGTVERGTLVVSVAGTGQISSQSKVDIKPKVSGDITSVNVIAGQQVKEGDIIAKIDSRDAATAASTAKADLISAQISLAKIQTSSVQTKGDAAVSLTNAYDSGYNTLSDLFTTLPKVLDDADDILNSPTHSPYMTNNEVRTVVGNSGVETKIGIVNDYTKTKNAYDALFNEYKATTRQSDPSNIDKLLADSYAYSKNVSDTLKEIRNFVSFVQGASTKVSTELTSDKTTLDSDTGTINSKVTALLDAQKSISSARNDLSTASETYSSISGSNDPLDVQSAKLTVLQKQNAYQKALDTLSDYTVRAPFAGVVAAVSAQKGDSGSSGTAIATIITPQQIATISLNELDIAKIKVGQKATLTFDAIPNTTLTGTVASADIIGTVSQGVVSYNVDITLDTQNDLVKSGMSVSAAIITNTKTDTLIVPTTAIKSDSQGSYVQMLEGVSATGTGSTQGVTSPTLPTSQGVETGLASDTSTEITSGLKEGDTVIVRTITSSTNTAQTSAPSLFGNTRTGGGGNFRAAPTGR